MSAFGGKADIGHALQCLLLTQSGHELLRRIKNGPIELYAPDCALGSTK